MGSRKQLSDKVQTCDERYLIVMLGTFLSPSCLSNISRKSCRMKYVKTLLVPHLAF